MASQACEDSFNFMKNSRLVKAKRRFRRPQKCFGVAVSRGVADVVHRYRGVPCDVPVDGRSIKLKRSVFEPDVRHASMQFSKISTTSSTPSWYSPSAENWTARDADLALLRECQIKGSFAEASTAWLGELCKGQHQLLIRQRDGPWMFPLHYWSGSCVLALRARQGVLPGSTLQFWEPELDDGAFVLVVVASLDGNAWMAIVGGSQSCGPLSYLFGYPGSYSAMYASHVVLSLLVVGESLQTARLWRRLYRPCVARQGALAMPRSGFG